MKKQTLIIIPPYDLADYNKNYSYLFPIGVGYIISSIKKAGHLVDCINLNHEVGINSSIKKQLDMNKYSYVMFGSDAMDYRKAEQIIKEIRKHKSNPKIVLGGSIITCEPKLMFKELKPDFAVIGEAEETVVELLDGKKLRDIHGLIFKEGGKIIRNHRRKEVMDLDTLPFPDYEAMGFQEFLDHMNPSMMFYYGLQDNPKFYLMLGSRSCPWNCSFCWHVQKYRERSIDNIIEEMEFSIKKYGINIFFLIDECIAVNKNRLFQMCDKIKALQKRLNSDFVWVGMLRVDVIDDEILKAMKESGCKLIGYGFESYSEKVLKSMNKRIIPEQIKNAFWKTIDAKINVHANFIFGDIAETKETIKETMDFYNSDCDGQVHLGLIQPYPNSKIYQSLFTRGILKDKLSFFKDTINGSHNFINMTDALSKKEFKKLQVDIFKAIEKHRRTLVPKITESYTNEENHYDLESPCPYCEKVFTYKNYHIPKIKYFNFTIICRDCGKRFCLASSFNTFLLKHISITRHLRNWRFRVNRVKELIKNKVR